MMHCSVRRTPIRIGAFQFVRIADSLARLVVDTHEIYSKLVLRGFQFQGREAHFPELRYRIGCTGDLQICNENTRNDRGPILRGGQPGEALGGRKPQRAGAVAKRRLEFSMRQAVGAGKVADVAVFWVQAVHAFACSSVDAALEVFDEALDGIARHSPIRAVDFYPRSLIPGVHYAAQAPAIRANPQATRTGEKREDGPCGQAILPLEVLELAAVITIQPTVIHPHPDVSLAVFGKRAHKTASGLAWNPGSREVDDCVCVRVPSHQPVSGLGLSRSPDTAFGILEYTEKYAIARIAHLRVLAIQIGRLGCSKPAKSLLGCCPPFSSAALEQDLLPSPSGMLVNLLRSQTAKSPAVEEVDRAPARACRHSQQRSGAVFKHGHHAVCRQAIRFTIGGESQAGDSHHPGPFGSRPNVAGRVLG